jgi:hypothetical protein
MYGTADILENKALVTSSLENLCAEFWLETPEGRDQLYGPKSRWQDYCPLNWINLVQATGLKILIFNYYLIFVRYDIHVIN